MTERRELRIGHAERDRAVEILQSACADGRLRLDELDGRVEGVLAAKTASELRPFLADLVPGSVLDQELTPGTLVPTSSGMPAGQPGATWQNPLVLTATMGDIKRFGAWEIPPFLEVHAIAGTIKLNCVEARPLAPVIDIQVRSGAGDVVVIVPPGWGVDVTSISTALGDVKTGVSGRPEAGCPLIVLRGQLGMGDIKVRHPNAFDDWQADVNRGRRR